MESITEWLRTIRHYIGLGLAPLWQSLRSVFIWPITWKVALGYLTVGFAGILLCLTILITFVANGFFGVVPSKSELRLIRNSTASEVYSRDGVLIGRYFFTNRVNAELNELSDTLVNALIATEDARFMKHSGIDLRALFRVLFRSIVLNEDSSGGGSTLSQQLAKNLYPRRVYRVATMLINKIREMVIARRIEDVYTKKELLGMYLNTVSFSDNVFGIKVAAQRFFNKSPKDLKIEEAAILVGMLKATTSYNPRKNTSKALERRNLVLERMHKYKYLSDAELDSLANLPLRLEYDSLDMQNEGLATYFREYVRQELEGILKNFRKPNGEPYNHYTDGLKIYTTIDARLQNHAEQAVFEQMPKIQRRFNGEWSNQDPWENPENLRKILNANSIYQGWKAKGYSHEGIIRRMSEKYPMELFDWKNGSIHREMSQLDSIKYYLHQLNTGLIAIEPETGAVRAWVGGFDHKFVKYDHVKSSRQVGSTFKPILYAQAVESGMDPCKYFPNQPKMYAEYENWQPKNSDNSYGGGYSLEGALTKSVNTVSVQIIMETGINPVRKLAGEMGIKSKIPYAPSIALGTVETSLQEMVQAYSVFVNRGIKRPFFFIERIETADGDLIADFGPNENVEPEKRVLSERTADIMLKMMRSVTSGGTASSVRWKFGINSDFAGKTGTTQNQSDGWFIGLTQKLVAGVWVGAESPIIHFKSLDSGQGAATALPIWGAFMKRVYEDPRFSSWKDVKMAVLPDSTRNRISCAHRIWYPSDSLLLDSLGNPLNPTVEGDSTIIGTDTDLTREDKKEERKKRREQKQLEKGLLNGNKEEEKDTDPDGN
ncbi:transglycosylase domain-containing protein [Haliscomenobacter hydrossis]|uniref:Peptidoglycan glycosyltransferase n=1 Tax=Haliscomenobacter hydrossis (strain ATCC 27775 / DSM 1100 / LMG 10767 / O) TaxID=760192 RepID=F4L6S3_HALH1|nr:transglycosylase domain-containing protein [Haliscomenobacter hydrossis]AEE50904.1 Peptidoglycan glycosyltransferase [Haliscomenobacter hydrossis DSM 1100]